MRERRIDNHRIHTVISRLRRYTYVTTVHTLDNTRHSDCRGAEKGVFLGFANLEIGGSNRGCDTEHGEEQTE